MVDVTHALVDTATGDRLATVKAHGSWKDSMTSVGTGQHSISLAGTTIPRATWRSRTSHWARSLVEYHDGIPKWWGLISRRVWDPRTKVLTLHQKAPMVVFESRFPYGVGSFDTDPLFQIASASLASAVERALYRGTGGGMASWGPEWRMPLRFHRLAETGSFSKFYPKSDRKKIAAIVQELRRMDGGPDLALIPILDGGALKLDVLTGAPRISGPTLAVPMSVRNSRVKDLLIDEDGVDMVSGVFATGEGYGDDRPVGRAGYFTGRPADAPLMIVRDIETNAAMDTDDEDLLDSQAQEYLEVNTWPVAQLGFSISVEQPARMPFRTADLRLGTRLSTPFSGDEFAEPITTAKQYVMGLGFNTTKPNEYTVEVQAA